MQKPMVLVYARIVDHVMKIAEAMESEDFDRDQIIVTATTSVFNHIFAATPTEPGLFPVKPVTEKQVDRWVKEKRREDKKASGD